MTAYGVASRSMYSYDSQLLTFEGRSIFRYIVYPTYYLMYGNVGNELDNLDGKNIRSEESYSLSKMIDF